MSPIIARIAVGALALVTVTAAHTAEPLSVSGIYPHLTVFNSDPSRESRQLFIASYAIDEAGTVRVIPRDALPGVSPSSLADRSNTCFPQAMPRTGCACGQTPIVSPPLSAVMIDGGESRP